MLACRRSIGDCSAMWGVFAGIGVWCVLYPWITEWLDRRAALKALAEMRLHSKQKHQWDPLRGRWME